MVQLVADYTEIIEQGAQESRNNKEELEALIAKHINTPIDQLPIEEALIIFRDFPVNEIPEQIRPALMNAAVQKRAAELGPEKRGFAGFTSEEATQLARFGVTGPASTRTSKAALEGMSQGFGDSLRALGILPERSLTEEFDARVEAARDPADYYTGLVVGGSIDPVGMLAGGVGAKAGMALASKALPQSPKLAGAAGITAGGTLSGATQGSLIPTYEEFGDSRARNTLFGAAIGTGIAGVPAVAGAAVDLVRSSVKPPMRPVSYQDELVFPPVPRANDIPYKPESIPVPTTASVNTATVDIVPQVTQNAPSTLKIQNIDKQIADLEIKAAGLGRKNRKPIESQIKKLSDARQKELNKANEQASVVKQQVIDIENQLNRLSRRKDELQPSEAGAAARKARAERRQEELESEKDILTGFSYAPQGGYKITLAADYNNPSSIVAVKNRLNLNNKYGVDIEVELAPPVKTGDAVTDAANELTYFINSPVRMGLDAPPSASSAGVRPAVLYADEVAEGVDPALAMKAGTVAPSTARSKVEETSSPDTGRRESMTQEEIGRRALLEQATVESRKKQQARQMGMSGDDVDWAVENIPTISEGKATYENLEQAAARLKAGPIGRDYDTLVEFVMEQEQQIRLFSAEEMEALRPLFLEAENRIDSTLRQMKKLQKDGLADSEDMVKLVQDLYFNTYIADLRRTNGRAASHILIQAKKSKKFTSENTRRLNDKRLITNLFGVECG